MKKEIKTDVLVIGNSAAAIGAAQAFFNNGYKGKVVFVTKEEFSSYSRPFIVYYAGKKIAQERVLYRTADYLKNMGFEEYLGVEITEIDRANRVAYSKAYTFHYQSLIIASGSKPIIPPIEGLSSVDPLYFMTLKDAELLRSRAREAKSALVIGGGLIGLKAIEALHLLGKKVYVVDMADYLMSRALDEQSARLMQSEMQKLDTDIFTNTTVKYVEKPAQGYYVAGLSTGKTIEADMIIVSVGVQPALDFIGQKKGYIEVDNTMGTGQPGEYAAGDVTSSLNILTGKREPIPIWPAAYKQGFIAATNISGEKREYRGSFPQNVLEFNDYPVISYGLAHKEKDGDIEMINFDESEKAYRKAIIRNGRLIGMILAGKIDKAGIYKGIMENQLNVEAIGEKLVNFDFDYKDLPEDYFRRMFYSVSS